jgi:hypothetical protein
MHNIFTKCIRKVVDISEIPYKFRLSFDIVRKYSCSTFVLAQGVFRKNARHDFRLGWSVKHLILISSPSVSKP